ncbi:hypothetical protein BUALT_Bualt04G0105200 [Buddleja alternifolia]|uniref:RING-type domain-containing protein n=1 Tax=Buddleja alternifolia TaxID=168488 RepID=A0AAV6XUB5_9LAMI|nr:hypothetical protein BUALT_Bualt04G0105200 [Buddleja alternifolia]
MAWIAKDSREINQYAVTITFKNDDYEMETQLSLDYALRLVLYAAIIAIFLMIITLIVKLMWNIEDDGDSGDGERATENSSLLSSSKEEVVFSTYGTSEEDLEACKGSSTSSSSEDDLYDGQICVICYDDQRNCFFIPCGHCVTCYTCAKRIISEEMKTCPICRTPINKVRKLHIL